MLKDAPCICMYAPSADGGMALYAHELTAALAAHRHGGYRFELVAGQDLQEQFRRGPYPVHPVLPLGDIAPFLREMVQSAARR